MNQQDTSTNGLAIAGFVCSLLTFIPFAGFVFWVCAVVFSSIGLQRAKRGAPYKGLAIAGFCISMVALAVCIIIVLAIFGVFAAAGAAA